MATDTLPKKFKCSNCGRETYSFYEKCLQCGEVGTVKNINSSSEEEKLRKKLHNTIDAMTFEQLQKVKEFLNFSNEFAE